METQGYFDPLEAIKGPMMVQRKTTGSLFKEPLQGLIVLPNGNDKTG